MVKTVITGDEVEIKGFCGVDNLTVRQGLNLVDPNVDVVSTGSITTGSLVNTGSSTLKGDVSMEGNASVEGDMSVVGNNSVGGDASVGGGLSVTGDLTVLGNLDARLAVHVVEDTTYQRNISAGQLYQPGWFTTTAFQSKQALIDLNDASGFKLLESGIYAIYFRVQLFASGGVQGARFIIKNNRNFYNIFYTYGGGDQEDTRFFLMQGIPNDIITIELDSYGTSNQVKTSFNVNHKTQFGVIKLA
jgi:hypothetical protein